MLTYETSEPIIRLGIFIGAYTVFAGLESVFPRRKRTHTRLRRWPNNIGISILNQVIIRTFVSTSAIAIAVQGAATGSGLMNQIVLPLWAETVVGILILDLAIYLQHILFHAVPVFWRLHRMHHADTDFDISTGIRFHPISIVISALLKLAVVYVLGPSALAVLIFEVLLNATSLFNHSNTYIPDAIERFIRLVVVTPDMHRIHHSIDPNETNTNFGFNFPWWDRLFGTYKAQPVEAHSKMKIGLDEFRDIRELRIDRLLTQPFRGASGNYSINRTDMNVDLPN